MNLEIPLSIERPELLVDISLVREVFHRSIIQPLPYSFGLRKDYIDSSFALEPCTVK